MVQEGFCLIIHPGLGPDSVSEVPESSLQHHFRAGWRLVTDEDRLPSEEPQPPPPPVTVGQVAEAHAAKAAGEAAPKPKAAGGKAAPAESKE